MDKTAGTLIREFEEKRIKAQADYVLQIRKMFENSKKENNRLREKLRKQTLMHEQIRTGIIGLIKKVDNTIYPCEYNDALSDVIDLINKLELENEDKEQEECDVSCGDCDDCEYLYGDCCRFLYKEKEDNK